MYESELQLNEYLALPTTSYIYKENSDANCDVLWKESQKYHNTIEAIR